MSKFDPFEQGKTFYDLGMQQLDNVLYDESLMKKAVLITLISRGGLLLSGAPGGGKTLLGANVWRLIEGVGEDDVYEVPIDSNLQEQEIAGGEISSKKSTELRSPDGSVRDRVIERSSTEIDAGVTEDTYGIFADEITRIRPKSFGTLSNAIEQRRIRTRKKTILLPNFRYWVSTMNPEEVDDASFQLPMNQLSRHGVGVIAGNDITPENESKLQHGIMPEPEKVEPVASVAELDQMGRTVSAIKLPDTDNRGRANWVQRRSMMVQKVHDELKKEVAVVEKQRLNTQFGLNARIMALFRGTGVVTTDDLFDGMQFVVASRVGGKYAYIDDAPELIDSIMHKVKEVALN